MRDLLQIRPLYFRRLQKSSSGGAFVSRIIILALCIFFSLPSDTRAAVCGVNASYDNAGQISETAKCPSGTSENFQETATGWSWDCVGGTNPTRVSCSARRQADIQPVCGTQVGGTNCTCAAGTANGCTLSGCLSGRWTGTGGQYGREWDCIGPNAYRGPTVRCFTPLPGQEPYSCPTSTSTGSGSGSGGGGTTGTTSGTCGTANGATLTCGDLMSCLGGKTICASGTSSPISGTEPSGANALALHNPTTSSTWVGWDWTCGGSSKCLACLPGYVQSGGTCVPQGQTGGGTTSGSTCGTANKTVYACNQFSDTNCSGGVKTECSSGSSVAHNGTEPSDAADLALFNNGAWAGWDWDCGSNYCFACRKGYVVSGNTCVQSSQVDGVCGTPHKSGVTTAPTLALCKLGTASALSGSGPWTWTCAGIGGGSNVSCTTDPSGTGGTSTGTGTDGAASCTVSAVPEGSNQYRVSYSINWGNATYTSVSLAGGGGLSQTIQKTSTTQSGSALASSSGGSMIFKITPLTGFSPGPGPLCFVTVNPETGTDGTKGTGETIQIPGYCGNAATNYTNSDTQYSGSFCYTGIQEPLNPAFPPQNGSSQWTCKGLTGGTDSSTCTATRNSTLPQTCSTYTASTTIPVGYGSPFNQLSGSKESLLSIACSSTASGATANAGSTQSDTYTYKTGFVSQNGTWSKIDFSGNPDPNNAGWFKGVATASLPAASSSQNFVAAFICQYNGGKWKCGCRDSACSQNYWTLQAYQK